MIDALALIVAVGCAGYLGYRIGLRALPKVEFGKPFRLYVKETPMATVVVTDISRNFTRGTTFSGTDLSTFTIDRKIPQ